MADTTLAPAPAAAGALAAVETDLLAPVYVLPRLEVVSGKGPHLTDAAGRTYLDFVSGIAVNALGHAPAGLARAIAKQAKTLVHSSNLYATPPAIALARSLTRATGYDRVFFSNSGTEAVEGALKFARAHARARGIEARDVLAFQGGFHGRTAWAVSATWTKAYREPFAPLVPGVRFAPYNDVSALDGVLDGGVAAVIVEPVQGESGAVPATRDFLAALRARTSALGATLIFDEIQCGMGRSGRLLAAEHFGVKADVTVLSKALGGGLPLGAVLVTNEVAASLAPGMHGSTFGGGPVSCAAGQWVLDKVSTDGFLAGVRRRARTLEKGLKALVKRHPSLVLERGLGLLRAVEIAPDAGYDAPALILAARERGLLVARGGERAVRLLPPLNVPPREIENALAALDAAVTHLESTGGTL